jgi:hypothetical protein
MTNLLRLEIGKLVHIIQEPLPNDNNMMQWDVVYTGCSVQSCPSFISVDKTNSCNLIQKVTELW